MIVKLLFARMVFCILLFENEVPELMMLFYSIRDEFGLHYVEIVAHKVCEKNRNEVSPGLVSHLTVIGKELQYDYRRQP